MNTLLIVRGEKDIIQVKVEGHIVENTFKEILERSQKLGYQIGRHRKPERKSGKTIGLVTTTEAKKSSEIFMQEESHIAIFYVDLCSKLMSIPQR